MYELLDACVCARCAGSRTPSARQRQRAYGRENVELNWVHWCNMGLGLGLGNRKRQMVACPCAWACTLMGAAAEQLTGPWCSQRA